MLLDDWQKRLGTHFGDLAARKQEAGYPLFALEHPLTPDEFAELTADLAAHIACSPPSHRHWLAWIVFAAEVGYDYAGEEYWGLVENRVPGWKINGRRPQIRDWYERFAAIYNAVTPTGPWAAWFSIIAWPITHAILPRDLQHQFTRSLYALRYRLAGLSSLHPASAGRLIAAHVAGASSRFEEFLQQEELAGAIALALLAEHDDSEGPIFAPTLQRLIGDLEKEHRAKTWLGDARATVSGRMRLPRSRGSPRSPTDPPSQDEIPPRVRPRLTLQPEAPDSWKLLVEIPCLAGLMALSPAARDLIVQSRCQVAGAGDTWLPPSWLARSAQKRKLTSWPSSDRPILSFEKDQGVLAPILDANFCIPQGPFWLFKVGTDGVAREVLSRTVHPGKSYIILTRALPADAADVFVPQAISCAGIVAAKLQLPAVSSLHLCTTLQRFGITVTALLEIWPVGLPALGMSDSEQCDWLTTDSPAFAICADFPIERLSAQLGSAASVTLTPTAPPGATLFTLAPLPPGEHTLKIVAHARGDPLRCVSGELTLTVNEPEPWVPGTTAHAGLAVLVEPPNPTLDHLIDGVLELTVLGPDHRRVVTDIALFASASQTEALASNRLNFCLPIRPSAWQQAVETFLDRRQQALHDAAAATIAVNADRLGVFTLRLTRKLKPLRWASRTGSAGAEVCLLDDTGNDQPLHLEWLTCQHPSVAVPIAPDRAMQALECDEPRLYVARKGDHDDLLAATIPRCTGGFDSLITVPDTAPLSQSPQTVAGLVIRRDEWRRARLAGPLARQQRDKVVAWFNEHILSSLCGPAWARLESSVAGKPAGDPAFDELKRCVGHPSLAGAIAVNVHRHDCQGAAARAWFADRAKAYLAITDPALCDLALIWAQDFSRLIPLCGPHLADDIARALGAPVLLRAARLFALLSSVAPAGQSQTESMR